MVKEILNEKIPKKERKEEIEKIYVTFVTLE